MGAYDKTTFVNNELIITPVAKKFISLYENGGDTGVIELPKKHDIFLEHFILNKLYHLKYGEYEGNICLVERKGNPALKFNSSLECNKELWSEFKKDYKLAFNNSLMNDVEFTKQLKLTLEFNDEYIELKILSSGGLMYKSKDQNNYSDLITINDHSNNQLLSVVNFFKSIKEELILPSFQRDYSWTPEECNELIEDLIYTIEINKKGIDYRHFMGNILIQNNKLLDGQQRITTFILLLKVFDNLLNENFVENTFLNNGKLVIKYNIQSEDVIKNILNSIEDEEVSKLKTNFNVMYQKVSEIIKKDNNIGKKDLIKFGIDKFDLYAQTISSNHDENMVFETINNRGKKLTNYDLIKSFILKNDTFDNSLLNKYNPIVEKKEYGSKVIEVTESIQQSLFRNYLAIKTGELYTLSAFETKGKTTYRGYKNYIFNEYNSNEISEEIFDLEMIEFKNFFPYIREAIESEEFKIKWIRSYYSETIPLIAVILFETRNNENEKNKLLDLLINYILRLMLTKTQNTSWIYAKITNLIYQLNKIDYTSISKILMDVEKLGKKPYVFKKDNEISEKKELDIAKGTLIVQLYENIFFGVESKHTEKIELEHIYPQSYDDYHTNKYEEDIYNRVGNFLPLEKDLNIDAKNYILKYKIDEYKKSETKMVREFLNSKFSDEDEFDVNAINERGRKIINDLLSIFPYPTI